MENTEETMNIVPKSNDLTLVDEMARSKKQTFCSIEGNTAEERKQIFNAMSKCDYRVADMLNQTITLKDVIIQKYTSVAEDTGEVSEKNRIILIDNEGKTYASASRGLYNGILRLFAIVGMPATWKEPMQVQVCETTTKKGQKTYELKIM